MFEILYFQDNIKIIFPLPHNQIFEKWGRLGGGPERSGESWSKSTYLFLRA